MTHEEILEMYRHKLERPDFTFEDKQATRINIRRLLAEKMSEHVCVASDHCTEPATHEYMKDVWICRTHHEEGYAVAVCAKCSKCPAWVILYPRSTNPEPGVYEFTCPVESCKTQTRVSNRQTKWIGIPNKWSERGYFYDFELREL